MAHQIWWQKAPDLFDGHARKDPFTRNVPATVVNLDFQNTYNVIGYCGIDPTAPAVDYYIVGKDQTTTTAVFMDTIHQSIAKGFLHAGDILVLDKIYCGCTESYCYRYPRDVPNWILLNLCETCLYSASDPRKWKGN